MPLFSAIKFKQVVFLVAVILFLSGCITFVRRVDPKQNPPLEADEGIVIFPDSFVSRYSQATFVERNSGKQFKIGYDLPDGTPLAYAVSAGRYCLLALKYKADAGYNTRRFLTLELDGKSICFNVYPKKIADVYIKIEQN